MRPDPRLLRGVVLGVLSIGLPLPMIAQGTEQETVPMELLRTLSLRLPIGGGSLPEVLVGGIPEGLDRLIPVPPDGRVVGSLDYSAYSISSVAVPDDMETASEEWALGLDSLGWERYDSPPQRGFVTNVRESNQFCLGESRSLSLSFADDSHGGSYVILIARDDPRYSPCRNQTEAPPRRPESPIPALSLPQGARSGGGGSGGGGDEWRADARIRTDLPVSALLSHYAAQLEREGWTPGDKAETDGIAVQTFSVSDAEGRSWYAVLSASLPPGGEERLMALRMVMMRDSAGSGR